MRLIDADNLYEKVTTWEAMALAECERLMYDEEAIEEWKIWSAILKERSAFKGDVIKAPTITNVIAVQQEEDS